MRQQNPVGRPKRCRRINHNPDITYFKPAGVPVMDLEEMHLTLDELEALRLADLNGFYQDQAAKEMQISRQTFGRILVSAHKKIAEALIHGKYIKVSGGAINMHGDRKFKCLECNHIWEKPFGGGRPAKCPACGKSQFHRIDKYHRQQHKSQYGGKHQRIRATHAKDNS
jgi:predicted DNA-binding protein (UPF0251 family)